MSNKNDFKDVYIHESSFIDDNVEIGQGTKIWHFSHILKDSKIGNDCNFGQNVVVGPNVVIGNNVKIQNNVSVYEGVTLEDSVFCGPSCVFTNVDNPRSEIVRKKQLRKTFVKRGVTLGANCTIICGVSIGAFAFIGAGAVISKDVPSYALMVGVPAKQIGWMSEYGEKLDLPLTGNAETTCKHTAQKYELKGNQVTLID
jgi:UDP-2-acetamido-3-amino-2,3-dideoxy-glucuronate N-acetyltransferase|tara:strand:- start:762 stop:1361 length:600 start_codon:yes stop_codon:yes gene_type:complete